jgi:hypothetical protein
MARPLWSSIFPFSNIKKKEKKIPNFE